MLVHIHIHAHHQNHSTTPLTTPDPQPRLLEGRGQGQGGAPPGAGRAKRADRPGGGRRGRHWESEGDHRVDGGGAKQGARVEEPDRGGVREERGDAQEFRGGGVAGQRERGGQGLCQQHGRVDGRLGLHHHQGGAR